MSLSVDNLNCSFDGHNITVQIENDTERFETVRYECVYEMVDGRTESISGSAGVNPGQTSTVASNTLPADVREVAAKSLTEA